MRTSFTEQEITNYRTNGFVAIKDSLSRPEALEGVDAVRIYLDQALVKEPDRIALARSRSAWIYGDGAGSYTRTRFTRSS